MDFNTTWKKLQSISEEQVNANSQQQKEMELAKKAARAQLLAKKQINDKDDIEPIDSKDLKKGWRKIDMKTQNKIGQMLGANIKIVNS